MDEAVVNAAHHHRYELEAGGKKALAYYRIANGVITFTHTIVPDAMRGQGIGSRLIRAALADVRKRGLKVVATCPFVRDYIERHSEEQDLLAD